MLTSIEKADLERLYKDRHRCAHPSMLSLDVPYKPTAELTRTHLRNAVEILLQREPVQGKAAFDRICAEIKSKYFPLEVDDAKKHFESGPLKRARKSLVRDLIIGISKSFLREKAPASEHRRQVVAIAAIVQMHTSVGEGVLQNELSTIIEPLDDDKWVRVVVFFGVVTGAWNAVNEAIKAKAKRYVENVEGKYLPASLHYSTRVKDLREIAIERIAELSPTELSMVIGEGVIQEYCEPAVEAFTKSGSFESAKKRGQRLLIPVSFHLGNEQVKKVLSSIKENSQINYCFEMPEIIAEFFTNTKRHHKAAETEWQELMAFLLEEERTSCDGERIFAELRELMEKEGMWPNDVET